MLELFPVFHHITFICHIPSTPLFWQHRHGGKIALVSQAFCVNQVPDSLHDGPQARRMTKTDLYQYNATDSLQWSITTQCRGKLFCRMHTAFITVFIACTQIRAILHVVNSSDSYSGGQGLECRPRDLLSLPKFAVIFLSLSRKYSDSNVCKILSSM
jgi:hypothetical protein